ncbi:MAG TPA: DinB family protein [Ferruginibacter sp.]|nr:DNA polymerase [Chitinophagaceae bacterium]HRI25053.1 DinB family protein [Ferruginibacter sp.]
MKELLRRYAAYTIWANQKLFDCIRDLPEEQLDREIISSFSSIRKTMLHMWDAEAIWWQRLKLEERVLRPSDDFSGDLSELVKRSVRQSQIWRDWVDAATEAQLQHVFAYQNTKKEQFKQPVFEMLVHIANHGTYHRGQLVTMLRQLGVEKIPQTDIIVFFRKK